MDTTCRLFFLLTLFVHVESFLVQIFVVYDKQNRAVGVGAAGTAANNMLSLASKLLNLAVSSQDCTRNVLRRCKNQLGEGPQIPYVMRFTTWLARCALCVPLRHLTQSALRLTKLKLLPTGLQKMQ